MSFYHIYILALVAIILMMTILWILSIFLKNVSIVDIFWGAGFIVASTIYHYFGNGNTDRKWLVSILVLIWGLRLSIYLAWRNYGKGEDFRYKEFRRKYGADRYWWISYFQVFLLQGILMWLISAPLLGAQYISISTGPGLLDIIAVIVWLTGFIFEAGGDIQLARFKSNPENKGKVLNSGFWHYTRHPNYFGDSAVWWAYGILSLAAGSYIPVLGSIAMTLIIIKVSGVALLEKSLKGKKTEYLEYIKSTSAFIPWFPKRSH